MHADLYNPLPTHHENYDMVVFPLIGTVQEDSIHVAGVCVCGGGGGGLSSIQTHHDISGYRYIQYDVYTVSDKRLLHGGSGNTTRGAWSPHYMCTVHS